MIVVTGGAGFIGSNLVRELDRRGHDDVVVVDDLTDGRKFVNLVDCRVADYFDKSEFLARLRDGELGKIEAIFHQGACAVTTEWNGRYMMETNYRYSVELFEHCVAERVPLIYASSAAVYGASTVFKESDNAAERPLNVYGYSKLLFDSYVRRRLTPAARSPTRSEKARAGRRPALLQRLRSRRSAQGLDGERGVPSAGAGRRDGRGAVVRRQRRLCGRRAAARLRARRRRRRREHLVLRAAGRSGIFNVGTGASATFNDVANAIIAWHGKGVVRYIPFPDELKSRYQSFTEADITALRAAGYAQPFRDVRAGIKDYLDALGARLVTVADKVLVVGPSWVGDMVMAQALYKLLRQRNSAAEIHVVAPPWSLPVLARMPEVARGIELAVGHGELALGRRRALGRTLRAERYDRAIVLPRSAKAALVPWFAKVPLRTGYRGEWRYGLLNDVRSLDARLDQTVKRFVALGQPRGEALPLKLPLALRPRLAADPRNLERLRAAHGLEPGAPLAALMPGAEYGAAKRWPAPSYGTLAAALAGAGADVVVLGSAKEKAIGDEVAARARSPRVRNLCGLTSLADAVDLLAAADVAVSNDSGLLHVAAAAGAPVVAIYGSSSPEFTPPLTDAAAVVSLELECSPCFARDCPLKHMRCLNDLDAATVLRAVETLSREAGGGGPPMSDAAIIVKGRHVMLDGD